MGHTKQSYIMYTLGQKLLLTQLILQELQHWLNKLNCNVFMPHITISNSNLQFMYVKFDDIYWLINLIYGSFLQLRGCIQYVFFVL